MPRNAIRDPPIHNLDSPPHILIRSQGKKNLSTINTYTLHVLARATRVLTVARSAALPMRPGGTLAPVSTISFWKADSSCGVLSLSALEPPVVISDGNHPAQIQYES
jgi:hypothetical protein